MDIFWSVSLWIVISYLCQLARTQEIGDLRLVDGPTPNAGRVEFYLGFRGWYSICDAIWNIDDAIVVCRELGFPGAAIARPDSRYGTGTVEVPLAREWQCTGEESRLRDCKYAPEPRCMETVGVVCQAPGYLGCYADPTGSFNSHLRSSLVTTDRMTVSSCREHCRHKGGSRLVGLRSGHECFCSGTLQLTEFPGYRHSDRECQVPCDGNPDETCGGLRSGGRSVDSDLDKMSMFDLNPGRCDEPTAPASLRVHGHEYSFGDVITFECQKGFKMADSSSATAQCVMAGDGTGQIVAWNMSVPTCQAETKGEFRMKQEEVSEHESGDRQYIALSVLACLVMVLASVIIYILVKRKLARRGLGSMSELPYREHDGGPDLQGRHNPLSKGTSMRSQETPSDDPPCYQDLVRDYEPIADPKTGKYPVERGSYYQSLKPPVPSRPRPPPRYAAHFNIPGHPSYPDSFWI